VIAEPALRAFRASDVDAICGWIQTAEELDLWASLQSVNVDAVLFARWHADEDVDPYVLVLDGQPVGYGEIWTDDEEGEAELARIVIAPDDRGRGLGRKLTGLLTTQARKLGFDEVWLRVRPDNAAAISAYLGAGFQRATAEEEAEFNVGQPRRYQWMRARSHS
jgi:[ribosomal protein S18]-alanine N-acetyltransferase